MSRTHLTLALALVLATSGGAAADRGAGAHGNRTVAVRDAPECGGKGFTAWRTSGTTLGCTHTAGDAFDSRGPAAAKAMGSKPAVATVPCYGDGTTGPRIQMIYGYYDGLPNRSAAVTKQFRTQMAPRMQAVINGQAHGLDLGLRFTWTKGCGAIDVKAIKFPRSVQYGSDDPSDPGPQLVAATKYLASLGYDRDDRKYQILWDGWNGPACGIGWLAADESTNSLPHTPDSDGLPTVGGRTSPDVLSKRLATHVSMVFNHAGGQRGGTCFNTNGISTVLPQVHELFHTLGAVQYDAPHANTGHCDDAPSIMCPGGGAGYGLGIIKPECAKVVVETLDCGEDDYWNPEPEPGSYLSTHLNIAQSQFFGPQPQDELADAPL